jgi:hypothetical protein
MEEDDVPAALDQLCVTRRSLVDFSNHITKAFYFIAGISHEVYCESMSDAMTP